MNFNTLLFIHKLLNDEAEKRESFYLSCRDRVELLVDQGAGKEELKKARQIKELADRKHMEALAALNDFVDHEWR